MPVQKLPLLAPKFASDSRDMGASFRASLGSFSRDSSWVLTVGAGLEVHGDVGTLGQKWSSEEPGEACESLNLLESKREGTEADCCFWLHRWRRKGGCQRGNCYSLQRKSTDWPAGRCESLLQWVQATNIPTESISFCNREQIWKHRREETVVTISRDLYNTYQRIFLSLFLFGLRRNVKALS